MLFLVIHISSECIEYPPNLALFMVIYQFHLVPTHMFCCEIHFLHDDVIWLNNSLAIFYEFTDKLLFSRIILSRNRLSRSINLISLHRWFVDCVSIASDFLLVILNFTFLINFIELLCALINTGRRRTSYLGVIRNVLIWYDLGVLRLVSRNLDLLDFTLFNVVVVFVLTTPSIMITILYLFIVDITHLSMREFWIGVIYLFLMENVKMNNILICELKMLLGEDQ